MSFVITSQAIHVGDDVGSHGYLYEVVGGDNGLVMDSEEGAGTCPVRKLSDSDGDDGAGDH